MNDKTITIFTPTYNRGYIIEKLYQSLCAQTLKDFVWLVVDDGSTDDTKEIIQSFISEHKIEIEYYYQNNAGKMVAHNYGVELTKTKLFLCVDSDDFLASNAVEIAVNYPIIPGTCGFVAYRGDDATMPMGGRHFPRGEKSSLHRLYERGFKGDTSLVYYTDIIKQYKSPIIEGEKFIPESWVYDLIDQKYELTIARDILIICKYLEDGFTKNYLINIFKNPKGITMFYENRMSLAFSLESRLRAAANYVCYTHLFHYKSNKKKINRILYVVAYPFGMIKARKLKKPYLEWKMKNDCCKV